MKKSYMIVALLAMLMPMMVFGNSHSTHYGEIKVIKQTGEGTVYVATANTATSGNTSADWDCGGSSSSDSKTFYIFAKPSSNYEFLGWTDKSSSGTPDNQGTLNNGTYYRQVTPDKATSTDSGSRTTTKYYAHFIRYYNITLAAPDDTVGFNGYTYSGDGISGTQSSSGGTNVKVYDGKTYTFTCNLKDTRVYKFAGWNIGGTTVSTANPYSTSFSAAATIKAVIAEKENCTVTLAAPTEGSASYTVSGDKGFNDTGLAAGATFKAYNDETYTFTCNIVDPSVYELAGWEVDGTVVTTDATLTRSFTPKTTATVKAVLNMKEQYRLTLTKPTGVTSYTVTGPTGADGLSNGGKLDFFGTADFTFNCTIDDNYKFLNWAVTDGDGTSAPTTRTLQKRVSSNTSVAAVVAPKETYSLTLEKPEGVTSYTVTATPGGAMGSLSAGGPATVREQDSYRFECAINDVEYVFVRWLVTGANGSTIAESEDRVFTTTFSSAATVTAVLYKKGVYELTFVKPEQVTSFSITGPNGAVSISEEWKATVYELDEYQITCAFDEDNWEIVNWTVTDSSGESTASSTLNNKTFNSDATVTVTLAKIEAFIATCPAVPSGCSYKVRGGTTTSDETVATADKRVKGTKGQPLTVTLSAATAGSGYLFAGWYVENADGSRTYISKDSSVTQTFNSHVKIGADFVSSSSSKTARVIKGSGGYAEYDDLNDAFRGLGAGDSITIYKSATLSQNAVLSLDASLTISQGVTVTIASGTTLMIAGTVTNNGTISGSGTVALNYKTVTQESTINVPFPYGTDGVESGEGLDKSDGTGDGTAGKYVNTRVANGISSINNCTVSKTQWFVTVVNGDGETYVSTASDAQPVCVLCKVNRKIALNWITEVVEGYSSVSDSLGAHQFSQGSELSDFSYSEAKDNEYMTVLLADATLTAHKLGFSLDCAQMSFTDSATGNISSHYLMRFFNGTISVSGSLIRPHMNFYGCNVTKAPTFRYDYATCLSFYNSTRPNNISTSSNNNPIRDGTRINYYGGGSYKFETKSYTKVYWGKFNSDPTTYIAIPNRYRVKSGTKYEIEKYSGNAAHTFKIGNVEKDTLTDALTEAGASGKTIILQKDYTLNENVNILSTVDATLDLNGWNIEGTGSLTNKGGQLDITDCSGSVVVGIWDIPIICESGNLYFTKVKFQKQITANGGKCWFLSGAFNGSIVVDSSVGNPLDVAEIFGGGFASSTYTYATENVSLLTICPNGRMSSGSSTFQLARIPQAYLSGTSTYKVVAFEDSTLYTSGLTKKKRFEYSNTTDWITALALNNQSSFFGIWGIDCTLVFDRKVSASNITATASSYNITLESEVKANEVKSVLLPKLREISQSGSTQWGNFGPWTYGSFLPGGEHADQISMSVSSSQTDNNGTSCKLQMRLASNIIWQSGKKDWSYDIENGSVVIAEKYFVIGAGSNKAMIRPDVGEATFYETLALALNSVANNGTVMLANDCAENVTVGKECTIMVNGFNFTGSVTAAAGYQVAFSDGVYVVTKLGPSHPADYVVIPSVPAEWEAANGLDEGLTAEDLKHEDTNGNATWENAVMGQKRTTPAAIVTSTNGTETTANMEVSFKPPSNIGYTVKYAFDEVAIVGAVTNVVNVGSVTNTPTLDLSGVTTNSPSYFKMRAVLESDDDKHAIVTNVPVEKVIGVLKVDSNAKFTILAVPWKSFDGGNVKVSELVHAASLSTDDMLYAYDGNGNLKSWRVNDGVWVPTTDVVDGEQTAEGDPPAEFGLARGKGVWLKRNDTSKPIYLMGQPTTETATTTLTAATDKNTPSWNLVASPKLEAVDIATGAFKDNTDDEIIVPTASTPKHYTCKDGKWGYPGATVTTTKTVTLPNGQKKEITIIKSTHKTDDTTISPGKGFWYLNRGTESKTIDW